MEIRWVIFVCITFLGVDWSKNTECQIVVLIVSCLGQTYLLQITAYNYVSFYLLVILYWRGHIILMIGNFDLPGRILIAVVFCWMFRLPLTFYYLFMQLSNHYLDHSLKEKSNPAVPVHLSKAKVAFYRFFLDVFWEFFLFIYFVGTIRLPKSRS